MAKNDLNTNDVIQALGQLIKNNNVNERSVNEVTLELNKRINQKASNQTRYAAKIIDEMRRGVNCSMVSVPRIYHEYQPSFVIAINGCTVKVPADGQPRLLHNDYVVILNRRMRAIDNKIAFMRSSPNGDIRELRN